MKGSTDATQFPCTQQARSSQDARSSNKFTKDVIKCVIELMGRAEISGKNCRNVIEIVSRNLFLDLKDLPSERSSLRYADKGHVLAKQQLTGFLLQASHVNLHSDGTTRNHNKVVGHQLSTDGCVLLSCGFTCLQRGHQDTSRYCIQPVA